MNEDQKIYAIDCLKHSWTTSFEPEDLAALRSHIGKIVIPSESHYDDMLGSSPVRIEDLPPNTNEFFNRPHILIDAKHSAVRASKDNKNVYFVVMTLFSCGKLRSYHLVRNQKVFFIPMLQSLE
jgi:hypothetical protein